MQLAAKGCIIFTATTLLKGGESQRQQDLAFGTLGKEINLILGTSYHGNEYHHINLDAKEIVSNGI